jgi:hypothetical protein
VILNAARKWVEAADAPRYLQPLPEWLAGQGWTKPPPSRHRSRRAPATNGRRYGKPDMLATCMGYSADYAAQENGVVS